MNENKNIIIIAGPTATGKTQTSLRLASMCESEIVNFDSLLFYKELNIGTAKPNEEELLAVPHHLINSHSISTPINAADFSKIALPIIEKIHKSDKSAILVGGSGFYLQALLNGMYDSETTNDEIRLRSDQVYDDQGIDPFLEILKISDPDSFERYHQNDHYRIRRAVEHFWMTDSPFSKARETMDEKAKLSPSETLGWKKHFIYLDLPKDKHFDIIQNRSRAMFEAGLVDEVKALLASGFTGEEKPLKSIGYKETIQLIHGEFESNEAFLERLSINTRQLAKAQRTWFKKQEKIEYNPLLDEAKIENDFMKFLRGNK